MKKESRRRLIKQLITQNDIETQSELIDLLKNEGIQVTQTTISRDIREMNIVKMHVGSNRVKYALFTQVKPFDSEEKLRETLKESAVGIEQVEFMIIIHTDMDSADVITNYLDEVNYEEIAGTIAGIDTIIIIAYSKEIADHLLERFKRMMNATS